MAIQCVEESRMEGEFQVYYFVALRTWPSCLMPLSLPLFIYKDEGMKASAAKAGVRMSLGGSTGGQAADGSDPSIDHQNGTKQALKGAAPGPGKQQRQSMQSSCLEGWTINWKRPYIRISRVEKSASQ